MFTNSPVGTTGTFEIKADGSIDIKATIPADRKAAPLEDKKEEKSKFSYWRMLYSEYSKSYFESVVRECCGHSNITGCHVTDMHMYFGGMPTEAQQKAYGLERIGPVEMSKAWRVAGQWPTGTGEPRSFAVQPVRAKRNTKGLHAYCVTPGSLTRPLTGPAILGRFKGRGGTMYFLSPLHGTELMGMYKFYTLKGILRHEYELARNIYATMAEE